MRSPTIALAVSFKDGAPVLIETLSDSREILILEASAHLGEPDPLKRVLEHRERQSQEDNDFSDYVEDLLSKPFMKAEVQRYGVQWLKSRIRIEQFQKDENEAAQVIATYAFDVFSKEPTLRDFFLAGPKAQVRIRVIILGQAEALARSA